MVPTMARWRHGRLPPRCPSLPRSCSPPCNTVGRCIRKWRTNTASSAVSIPRFRLEVRPGSPRPLRARSGAGHSDDRELSVGVDLVSAAEPSVHCERASPFGFPGRLVGQVHRRRRVSFVGPRGRARAKIRNEQTSGMTIAVDQHNKLIRSRRLEFLATASLPSCRAQRICNPRPHFWSRRSAIVPRTSRVGVNE